MIMLKYCIKRFLESLVTIFIVVCIVFLLVRLMPIDGFFPEGLYEQMTPAARINHLYSLGVVDRDGDPVNPFIQLYRYLLGIVQNRSLGISTRIAPNMEVAAIIGQRVPITMRLNLISLAISMTLGYSLGILMAVFKDKFYGVIDHIGMAYIVIVTAVPNLVLWVYMQHYITLWLDVSMIYRTGQWQTLIAPVICLAVGGVAGGGLWMRRFMVDELNKDYVKLAYAKGLPTGKVMYRHVLRNAFVPMAYNFPAAVIFTMGGSLIMERLFSIPGMGRLLVDAVNQRDTNFVQALVLMFSAMGVFSVFLGDLFATIVDPRISLVSKGGTRK